MTAFHLDTHPDERLKVNSPGAIDVVGRAMDRREFNRGFHLSKLHPVQTYHIECSVYIIGITI